MNEYATTTEEEASNAKKAQKAISAFKGKAHVAKKRAGVFLKACCAIMLVVFGFILGSYIPLLSASLKGTKKVEITNVIIEEKLSKIQELATCLYEYTGEQKISNTREIFGHSIIGTTNSIDIIYNGVIKVGYDVSKIEYRIKDNKDKTSELQFILPKPKVLDNYIKLDDLQCKDNNNILNPIGSDDIVGIFDTIKQDELNRAEEKGIYDDAEVQLKMIIESFFDEFDYDVNFD